MREFNEIDRKKKEKRVKIPENPANLSKEELSQLEVAVKTSLKDGYLPCPVAWKIAKDLDVPKIVVGEITDRLGIRVTNCQIGCFKVDKTLYTEPCNEDMDGEIVSKLKELEADGKLTCERVFELAKLYKIVPLVLGNEASARNIKIRSCQLGCF